VTAAGPVIPNFGKASACITDNRAFCWGWVRAHWHDTLEPHLIQHVELTFVAVAIGFALAFVLALLSHRFRRLDQPVAIVAGLIYTIPSLAAFLVVLPIFGISYTTIEVPLTGYSLVLLYPNITAGLRAAPADVLEAAHGMGLTRIQTLWRVELPLAVPAIIGGLRIAAVSTVSIGTIAAIVGGKGLGEPIFIALGAPHPFRTEIYAAGGLVVVLALSLDLVLVVTRRMLVPWTRA
jgi:osmoprotectant transport system permease protein